MMMDETMMGMMGNMEEMIGTMMIKMAEENGKRHMLIFVLHNWRDFQCSVFDISETRISPHIGMKMQPSDVEMEMKMLRRGTYMVIIQTTLTMTKNMGMQVVKMMQNKKMSTMMGKYNRIAAFQGDFHQK